MVLSLLGGDPDGTGPDIRPPIGRMRKQCVRRDPGLVTWVS